MSGKDYINPGKPASRPEPLDDDSRLDDQPDGHFVGSNVQLILGAARSENGEPVVVIGIRGTREELEAAMHDTGDGVFTQIAVMPNSDAVKLAKTILMMTKKEQD